MKMEVNVDSVFGLIWSLENYTVFVGLVALILLYIYFTKVKVGKDYTKIHTVCAPNTVLIKMYI